MKYSIIIPAYNESERIRKTLEEIVTYSRKQNWDAEIIVVNDGSSDNTGAMVEAFATVNPNIRMIENRRNRGKGYSVRAGVLSAGGDILLFSDADLSTPIAEAAKLVASLQAGSEVAIGSRWLAPGLQTTRQPLHREIYGRIFNLLLRAVLGLRQKDTQCGFKGFTRRAALTLFPRQRIDGWAFDPELLFLARRFELAVAEVPVEWGHDTRSKIHPIKDGIKMAMQVLWIRWNAIAGKYDRPPAGAK